MKSTRIRLLLSLTLSLVAVIATAAPSPGELPPGSPELVQPEQLAKTLPGSGDKPTVLYVGPRSFYTQSHIRGAEYIGPAANPQTVDTLRTRVASLKKNSAIILYCGCCPWDHCPNIRPAYKELQKAGFTNVKALYLANSFGEDWAAKGYPVEKGQ